MGRLFNDALREEMANNMVTWYLNGDHRASCNAGGRRRRARVNNGGRRGAGAA